MEQAPNRIKELREDRAWSLRDLEKQCGVGFNTLNRLETGASPLDLDKMRKIAAAFGLPASALLNDKDVEFRADAIGQEIIRELGEIPGEDRPDFLQMTRELMRVVRVMASRQSAAALGGDPRQIGALADIWNTFDHGKRERAIGLLKMSGLITE